MGMQVIDALGLRLHAEAAQKAELSAQPGVSADVTSRRG
jgi:hypothetical protein